MKRTILALLISLALTGAALAQDAKTYTLTLTAAQLTHVVALLQIEQIVRNQPYLEIEPLLRLINDQVQAQQAPAPVDKK